MSNQVFINGKVFTADTKEPFEECFVVEDGVISWIGKQEDLPEAGDTGPSGQPYAPRHFGGLCR